jgi:GTPase
MKTRLAIAAICLAMVVSTPASYAQAPASEAATTDGTVLLTVFLHHDQSKNLAEINQELKKNGYYDQFPPAGVTVDSWYVVMGIGQIVTLRVPAAKLREVNTVLENTAWGPYRTEFFASYDYKAIAEQQRETMRNKKP